QVGAASSRFWIDGLRPSPASQTTLRAHGAPKPLRTLFSGTDGPGRIRSMRTMTDKGTVEIVPDAERLAAQVAELVIPAARNAINEHDIFNVALAGGSTPKAAYELLATDEYKERVAWEKVRIYFGDERNVPPEDDRSNFKMANDALLRPLGI